MKFYKKVLVLGAVLAGGLVFQGETAHADTRSYGPDWSVYQGAHGKYGTAKDDLVISQIGGTYGGQYIDQATYAPQVASAIAAGKRVHTYIWDQVGSSIALQKAAMDRFLPRVQTPKGSIVALDYEAGASASVSGNTDAILYGMNRIKAAGYTPMYYSYKPYTTAHVDYNRILRAYPNSLWIAAYKNYLPAVTPDFGYFPSLPGIAIWQFTSTYGTGSLDGNVDLLGATQAGYHKSTTSSTGKVTVKPKTQTAATKAGQTANATPKSEIKAGTVVKVNFSAKRWATGQAIPSFIKGKTYTVRQVAGNRVLLANVLSWANKSDVEILNTTRTVSTHTSAATSDYAQYKTFYPTTTVNVRTGMSTAYQITGTLSRGDHIYYNHIYIRGGYVWARYQSYTGPRYVALGVMGGQSYGNRY